MKHKLILHLFRYKRKLTWLGDEPRRWISKLFDIHRPTHRRWWKLADEPLIVPTTFISGDEDRRWSLSPRWESSLMTLVIHRRSECPNPLLRTSCSIVLDRNVVWRKLWCHRIYVNFTPSNERFFCIDTFARRADDVSFMTWLARPVIQSLYDGSLIFFPEKRRRGNVL